MKIKVINGPNINMLGIRNNNIYGSKDYDSLIAMLSTKCDMMNIEISFFQSNIEGEIVTEIQKSLEYDGIIINPAAYTHTSIAIHDALEIYKGVSLEVHLSNIHSREEFRSKSVTGNAVTGIISGLGVQGYSLAIDYIANSRV